MNFPNGSSDKFTNEFTATLNKLISIAKKYNVDVNGNITVINNSNNQKITYKLDNNSNISKNITKEQEQEQQTDEVKLPQLGGVLTEQTFKSDNTLTSGIFKTLINLEETETPKIALSTTEEYLSEKNAKSNIFKGGNLNSKKYLNDKTSELNTTIQNIFTKQNGGNMFSPTSPENNMKGGNFSQTSEMQTEDKLVNLSATSVTQKNMKGGNFSQTSEMQTEDKLVNLSATSVTQKNMKGGNFSQTSEMQTEDKLVNLSATSVTQKNMKGGNFSQTSEMQTEDKLVNLSATSVTLNNTQNMTGGNKIKKNIDLSKMETIRQKIRELENISDTNVFQKHNTQKNMTGGSIKQYNKVPYGINSSSTSSLCE
jgi:hypothetical protein